MDAYTLNLLVSMAVLAFFLVQGSLSFAQARDKESYFLVGRTLEAGDYAASFAASSTSLATVLFFFVTFGLDHGLYVVIAPLTYLAGALLFNHYLLPRLETQGFFGSQADSGPGAVSLGTTLGSYLQNRYHDKAVARSVLAVAFLGMLSVLLIELFVGVRIFSVYLEDQYVDWALVMIALVVFVYTGLGGLQAVVRTDKLQFGLILLSTVVFIGWLIARGLGDGVVVTGAELLPATEDAFLLPLPLLLNIICVNLLLIPALLRTWQLTAASRSSEESRMGLLRGALFSAALVVVFVFIGILFFKVVAVRPEVESLTLLHILAPLFTSEAGPWGSFLVLPLFFAACLAALVSTADSALIPLVQSVFMDFPGLIGRWSRKSVLAVTAALMGLSIGLYFIVFRLLGFDLLGWLFTIFSFLIIASPAVVFAVVAPASIVSSRMGRVAALLSIWGGLGVALTLSLLGNWRGDLALIQLNSPAGATVGALIIGGAWCWQSIRIGKTARVTSGQLT